MFHLTSTLVLILIALGLWQRHRRQLHIRLMSSAFVLDILTLLGVELQRHAVEQIVVAHEVPAITWFHVGMSVLMLVTWVVMIVLGRKIIAHEPNAREKHKRMAGVFLALRLTNYVTSFMV